MLVGGCEHVNDSAAHGKLAAPSDHIDPRIREVDQPSAHIGQVIAAPTLDELDGFHAREVVGERLQSGAHARDEHERGGAIPSGDGPQCRDALAHRFGTRAQPFVRERLPGRKLDDGCAGQKAGERSAQGLGFPPGRGDSQSESGAAGSTKKCRE